MALRWALAEDEKDAGGTLFADERLFRANPETLEQVRAILFLASEDASYITGTVLPVGGGDQG